jgi:hypothetical protein
LADCEARVRGNLGAEIGERATTLPLVTLDRDPPVGPLDEPSPLLSAAHDDDDDAPFTVPMEIGQIGRS